MSVKRKYSLLSLVKLYMSFIFNKATIILLLTSIILMFTFLYILSNPWMDETIYINSPKEITAYFFESALLVTSIFNSIIIATIVIMLILKSKELDILFISYVPRTVISIIKLIVLLLTLVIFTILEVLSIIIICKIRFRYFEVTPEFYIGILFILLSMLVEALASIVVSSLINTIFAPMVLSFLFTTGRITANNLSSSLDKVIKYIPLVTVDEKIQAFTMPSYIISIIFVIVSSFLFIEIYNILDLKNKE